MNTIVEIIIVVILIFFLVSGVRRGLIRQILQILGIIAAFIGAFYLAHHLAFFLENNFELHHRLSLVISAIALFVGIIFLFHFLGLLLQKVAHITILGSLDRIGGGLMGLLKGTLLVSLLLVIILNLPFPGSYKDELKQDPLVVVIYPVLPVLFNLVLSHSPAGLYFEKDVDRAVAGEALVRAKDKVRDVEKGLKKRKKQIEESTKGIGKQGT